MKAKTKLLIVVPFILLMLVPNVFAVTQVEDYTDDWSTDDYKWMGSIHPSIDTDNSAIGFSFNATEGGYLSNFTVQMCKYIAPPGAPLSGLLGARVVGCGNAYNSWPNASVYATSDTQYSIADLTLYPNYGNVTFVFDETYDLVENAVYVGYVYVISGTVTDTKRPQISYKLSGEHPTFTFSYAQSQWISASSHDVAFEVTSNSEPAGDPVSPAGSDMDSIIDNFVDFMVPLIVILLPALLLVFITRRADKWLILIGLAIGVGLGYYFGMVPAWLLFLVAIGMIGLAYSEVRRNG